MNDSSTLEKRCEKKTHFSSLTFFLPLLNDNLLSGNRTPVLCGARLELKTYFLAGETYNLLHAYFSLCLPTYTPTSQEKDHNLVTGCRFSRLQYHNGFLERYFYYPLAKWTATIVSTQRLFIKLWLSIVLLEGQFVKGRQDSLGRELRGCTILSKTKASAFLFQLFSCQVNTSSFKANYSSCPAHFLIGWFVWYWVEFFIFWILTPCRSCWLQISSPIQLVPFVLLVISKLFNLM